MDDRRALAPTPSRVGALRDGVGAGRVQHSEWSALLGRFARDGRVDYATMTRVRRLVEEYLRRLAEHDPETFIDADDQLAFYLNAYNAVAVHLVLQHYPVRSIRDIPGALTRPYPVGRRNVSLQTLHANLLRSFGDPRVHVAINNATRGAGLIGDRAFTGGGLQAELDAALRRFLGDSEHGARFDPATNTLSLSPIFRWFAGDFLHPTRMPGVSALIKGWGRVEALVAVLLPYFPADLRVAIHDRQPNVAFLPFDWTLNE